MDLCVPSSDAHWMILILAILSIVMPPNRSAYMSSFCFLIVIVRLHDHDGVITHHALLLLNLFAAVAVELFLEILRVKS